MSKLQNFLHSLTDHEFVIFYKNRYDEFISESKSMIDKEKSERGLTDANINIFLDKKIEKDVNTPEFECSKCGGTYFNKETDRIRKGGTYGSWEEDQISLRCSLCGYNSDKSRPVTFRDRVKKLFGFTHTNHIVRGE